MFKYSLKAGSLFYAIAIALVFALISAALILSSYFNRAQIAERVLEHSLQLNSFSGINILLTDKDSLTLNPIARYKDLYGNETDSVKLFRKQWGIWELGISRAYSKNKEHLRLALIGGCNSLDSNVALYLADKNKPLSLCGKTIIKGNAFLPKAGVKMAYIEGNNFIGTQLIDGKIEESKNALPALSPGILSNNQSFYNELSDSAGANDSIINIGKHLPDTINNPFTGKTIILYSTDKIYLDANKYKGNVIVVSARSIEIEKGCELENILIYAPDITINDGFKGSLQCFAGDSLRVGKDCVLAYPSSLNIITLKDKINLNPLLSINTNTTISGVLTATMESNNKIVIAAKTVINGEVYCNGNVELNGIVYGRVYCERFMLNTSSSIYENHLLNVTIDNSRLPRQFIGIDVKMEGAESKKGIVKWLN